MVSNRPGQHYEETGMLESSGISQRVLSWEISLSISSIEGGSRYRWRLAWNVLLRYRGEIMNV